MRTDLQLIQSAIADFDFTQLTPDNVFDYSYFKCYSIKLPEKFKGLPTKWHFTILPQQGDESRSLSDKVRINDEGNRLITTLIEEAKVTISCNFR